MGSIIRLSSLTNEAAMHSAYSVPEACHRLGVSKTTLYNLIREGDLPARKIGKRTIVLAADIDSFLSGLPTLK